MQIIAKFESREWDEFIKNIDDNVKEPTKLLRAVMSTVGFKDIMEHFSNEEGSDGTWKQRSEKTNLLYDRRGGMYNSSNKLLQLSGNLRKSILHAGAMSDKGKYAIAVTSNIEYASKHQEGENGMPKRDFLWLSDNALERMADTILNLVMKG